MTSRKALQSAKRLAFSGAVVAYRTARAQPLRAHPLLHEEADTPLAKNRAPRSERSGVVNAMAQDQI